MAKKYLRKCSICKREFDITNIDYLKKTSFMERQCYINKQLAKGLSIETINEMISVIENTMRIEENERKQKEIDREQKILQSKQRDSESSKYRSKFIEYIRDEYGVSSIPNHFYIKLASINNGTYKGLEEGIPYEDLLYIFKRKQKYFNSVYLRNTSKGKEITGISRVSYDLAIAINLHDEYKQWKRKQQILASDNIQQEIKEETEKHIEKINFNNIKVDKNNDDDISDILDDLY